MPAESVLKLGGVTEGDAVPLLMDDMVDELEQAKAWRAVDTVRVSVDLGVAAAQLLRLLRQVERRGDLYKGPKVGEAIRRYEQYWLVLARELPPEELRRLQPPLDVLWVWLVHRLNPEAYASDCEALCGRVIDGALFAGCSEDATSTLLPESDAVRTCASLWEKRFPEEGYHGEQWEVEGGQGGQGVGAGTCDGAPAAAGGKGEERGTVAGDSVECPKHSQALVAVAENGQSGERTGESTGGLAGQENPPAREVGEAEGGGRVLDMLGTPESAGLPGDASGVPDLLALSDSGSPGEKALPRTPSVGTPGQVHPEAPGTPGSTGLGTPDKEGAGGAHCGGEAEQGRQQQQERQQEGAGGTESCAEEGRGEGDASGTEEQKGQGQPGVYQSRLQYNLQEAVQRQAGFFFQVDRACMHQAGYTRLSLLRYKMFLHLVRLNQGLFCVPTFDVDLLWHAHMMCAAAYREDTIDLLGRVLGHDDSDSPAEPTSADVRQRQQSEKRLDWAFRATAKAWDRTYGMPFCRAGAMHRGPRHSDKISESPEAVLASAALAELHRRTSGTPKAASGVPRALVLGPGGGVGESTSTIDRINAGKGLRPRIVFEAQVMLWGALNLDPSPSEQFYVTMNAVAAAPDLVIRSRPLQYKEGWPLPAWQQRWSLQCELQSKGLEFELRAESDGFWASMWGPRLVGSGRFDWTEVLKEPSLFQDIKLELTSLMTSLTQATSDEASKKKLPALHVAVSVTPPEPGPYLLRMIFMRGTDDNGAMVCQDMYMERDCKPQIGRWVSRTVLDHADREIFVIRKRVAKGMWQGRYRPQAVHYREAVIVVHRGGWRYIETDPLGPADADPPHVRVGYVPGPIIAQAVPMASPDLATERTYCLLDCLEGEDTATLTIRRDPGSYIFIQGIHITLSLDSKEPVVLKPGRHMQFEVDGATHSEEIGYATLIRFTADAPRGKATGLLNWKGAQIQVQPGESVMLMMLLCVCLSEAINDMVGVNRVRRFRRVALPDYDPSCHWEAMCDRAHGPSVKGSNPGDEHDYKFASVERTFRHWWNRRPPGWHVGAASCGAGACGPSIVA